MPHNPLEVRAGPNVDPDVTSVEHPESGAGKLTTAILPNDEPVPDNLGSDEDEDIVPRRRGGRTNNAVDEEEEPEPTLDDDLFGEGSDDELKEEAEELAEPKSRGLDDQEIDSGDDEGRVDRVASEQPMEEETREDIIEFPEIDRKPVPEPSDGEMYLMKIPKFLAIEPHMFSISSFEPPTNEHHSRKEPPSTFSAYSTAMSTIRWRHSPLKPEEIQSNARILRWSDGSLTLQLASDPTQQFEIDGNPLAPPQKNPVKPTPTSIKPGQKEGTGPRETFTYLTVPHESVGLLRVTHRITAGLSILPSANTTDDALEKLQTSLAAAVNSKNKVGGAIELLRVDEDPELAKKKAEVAEREKMRAQKRREAAENRERERGGRGAGRTGGYGSRFGAGGLSASMLEDEEGGTTRPRAKPKAASRRKYNDEYSSDEDQGRRRGNFAQDDYEVDDFVAGSDEEEEAAEADSDEEEDIDDGIRERKKSPKRSRKTEEDDDDAEGEDDDVVAAPKTKRRRAVVDEDDDDE